MLFFLKLIVLIFVSYHWSKEGILDGEDFRSIGVDQVDEGFLAALDNTQTHFNPEIEDL